MNTKKTTGNRLATAAALCSSFLLLVACEPTSSSPTGENANPDSPTYGEPPERGLETSPTERETDPQGADSQQGTSQTSPGMDDPSTDATQDQWDQGGTPESSDQTPGQP